MAFSLYNRLTLQGTLSEPKGIPDPRYALPSTIHWMRSLCMLVEDQNLGYKSAQTFYSGINKKMGRTSREHGF